jgi:S1-C subfamily serine protease
MRQYELDKSPTLKQTGPFRLYMLKVLAFLFAAPGKSRNRALLLLLVVGLAIGSLTFLLLNQGKALPAPSQPGTSVVPQLGVLYVSSQVALKNQPNTSAIQGLVITEVKPGSSASQAGLLTGDVLTHLDGKVIQAEDSLLALLKKYKAGDALELGVYRNEHALTITVVLT